MKLSVLSTLSLAAVALGTALPKRETVQTSCVKPYLCCGELKTPLDSTLDPILAAADINASNVVGEVGLDCKAYDSSCPTAPKCCSEANLLGGLLALGCSDLASPSPSPSPSSS